MKRNSNSSIMREMQIKAIMKNHSSPITLAKSKRIYMPGTIYRMEKFRMEKFRCPWAFQVGV